MPHVRSQLFMVGFVKYYRDLNALEVDAITVNEQRCNFCIELPLD